MKTQKERQRVIPIPVEVTIPSIAVYLFFGGILSIIGIALIGISIKVMWWVVNSRQSAFRASASLLLAYFYFTIKYRYGDKEISEFRDSARIGDYMLKIEKIEDSERQTEADD
jgi:hypothetical protein